MDTLQSDIRLAGISKSFSVDSKKIKSIDDISLTLRRGELNCLIGPNGCGKTTLVKIIAGIEIPTSGVYDKPTNVAYVPQQDSLLPWFTVRENIELPGRIANNLDKKTQSRINKFLQKYKLAQFASFYPKEISGGMKQKTALIRAMVYRPDTIVLDEPFSALDAITRVEMRTMLADLWMEYKPTIICVTHDIEEAVFLSDRIFVMSPRPGKIIKTFNVNIKRPRSLVDLDAPAALKLKRNLHRLLIK